MFSRCLPDLPGGLTLVAGPNGLRAIRFECAGSARDEHPVLLQAELLLRENAAIPHAETRGYRDIERAVNRPKGFQAVGQANTKNPLPIVILCHRVIHADGSLGGYGGGLERKKTLLAPEQQYAHRFRQKAA